MNIDTDESDCVVVDTGGDDVRKRDAGLPAAASASSTASAEVGKVAVEEVSRWTRITPGRHYRKRYVGLCNIE
jgi:hypothetical protein